MISFVYSLQDCIVCAKPRSAAICATCMSRLKRRRGPFCTRCGTRLLSEIEHCLRCRELEGSCCYTHSLWEFNEVFRTILYQYKSARLRYLAYFFAKELAQYLQDRFFDSYAPESLCIVPLPANKKNIYKRGFDQSIVIARKLVRYTEISFVNCIKRKVAKEQKKLSRLERKENTAGSLFLSSPSKAARLTDFKVILLLDDIYTTGSTMQKAYELLSDSLQKSVPAQNILLEGLTLSRID